MSVKHYVTYYLPGTFFDEDVTQSIPRRDVKLALKRVPKGSFAFEFWSRTEVKDGGETLVGPAKDRSPRYYIGGTVMTEDDVRREVKDNDILLSNMRGNRWPLVIRTSMGNIQPFEKGRVMIDGRGKTVAEGVGG